MKKSKQLKALVQTTFAVVAATVMIGGLASSIFTPLNQIRRGAAAENGFRAVANQFRGN